MVLINTTDAIQRDFRMYSARLKRTSVSDGRPSNADFEHSDIQYPFERASVLARLGQFIMSVKVSEILFIFFISLNICQMSIPRKDFGWSGNLLLPLILASELHDSSFLVMGISPLNVVGASENISVEQMVRIYSYCFPL